MQEISETLRKRYILMRRGFCNIKDIQAFVPCGYPKAKEIQKKITEQISEEGFESLKGVILTDRLMRFMQISESKIVMDYEALKTDALE